MRSTTVQSFYVSAPSTSTSAIVRWTARRKAAVIEAIRNGEISLPWALIEYDLTTEEIGEWMRLYDTHGLRALRTTRLLSYRYPKEPKK
jgi:Protein of unknown function (DUF1153)